MREVTTKGVGWAFGEASDLVAPPLNLVLYMHLRIFAYTRILSFTEDFERTILVF